MQIQKFRDLTKKAFQEIKQYQIGNKGIIKTGTPYFDDVFPVVNGSVIVFSAGSGIGKSYTLAKMVDNILNKELNPTADNFVVLNISLEMRVLSLVLRGMAKNIKSKSKKEILLQEFTEEEKAQAKAYFDSLQDDRVSISQVPTTPNKFYEGCKEFLEMNKDKDSVIITVDHLALISGDSGESRNTIIEKFIERVNDLKMEYENVIFILLSQTNSEMIKRAKDKDIMAQPQPSDLYYSQFTFQVADFVAVMTNPTRLGIKEYSKIDPDRYPNLEKFFLEEDLKGRVSLEPFGVNYVHLLKCREADGLYLDIYAEELPIPDVENIRKNRKKESISVSNLSAPVFGKNQTIAVDAPPPPPPLATLADAFGEAFNSPAAVSFDEEDDDSPF
jgi:replicative DNA helicase